MHHFNTAKTFEMLPVKGIDGPDFGRVGKGDDPGVYEINYFPAVNRDGIRDVSLVADLDAMRMQAVSLTLSTSACFARPLRYPL